MSLPAEINITSTNAPEEDILAAMETMLNALTAAEKAYKKMETVKKDASRTKSLDFAAKLAKIYINQTLSGLEHLRDAMNDGKDAA